MYDEVRWLKDALSSKKIVLEMNYYKIHDGMIKATDGRIIAAHPIDIDDDFLVPGKDLERLLARMDGDVKITVDDENNEITVKSGRSRGTMKTLAFDSWDYPGIRDEDWQPIPAGLMHALRKLEPFVSENANHIWACGVTLKDGWAYATNNVAIAGIQVKAIGDMEVIIPSWTIDFILDRTDGIEAWAHTENYMAFKWKNGAWMRSSLLDSSFPEKVCDMIKKASYESPEVEITKEFRQSVSKLAELVDGSIRITQTEITGSFGATRVEEECFIEELGGIDTIWNAKFLSQVVKVADFWDPFMYPKPAPFSGDGVVGYIVGATQ